MLPSKVIDFDSFEELFKTGPAFAQNQSIKIESPGTQKKTIKKNENLTLLEAQRQRNLGNLLKTNNHHTNNLTSTDLYVLNLKLFQGERSKWA